MSTLTMPVPIDPADPGAGNIMDSNRNGEDAVDYKAYPPHRFANMFPLRDGQSLKDLSDSIKERGQIEEVVLYENMVLDGRRRQAAALKAGIKPLYREFGSRAGDGFDPLEFAFTVNFHRRDDLTVAEKAMAAAKYATMKRGFNQHTKNKADSTNGEAPKSQKEAAAKFGVPIHQIQRAKKVQKSGVPELQEAVLNETVSISDAAAIAGESAKVQRKAVAAVKNGKAHTLSEAVAITTNPPAEDLDVLCRDVDGILDRVARVQTDDVQTRDLACEAFKTAKALVRRLAAG